MRDFTKSMFSFSWALSMFGLQQMANMLTLGQSPEGQRAKATEAFDTVTRVTEEQLGEALRETFKAADKLQRGVLDMMFGAWMPRDAGMGPMMDAPMQAMQAGMQQMGGCCGQAGTWAGGAAQPGATGWGPMPAADAPAGDGPASYGAPRG